MGGLKKNGQVAKVVAPTYHGPLGGSCRAEKRGALPGGGWRRHCGAPGVGPRRPATRLGAARGSRVEEAATLRERVTRVGPSTVPNRRPPRGRPLRQVGASHIPWLGRRYSGKNAAYLKRVIAIAWFAPKTIQNYLFPHQTRAGDQKNRPKFSPPPLSSTLQQASSAEAPPGQASYNWAPRRTPRKPAVDSCVVPARKGPWSPSSPLTW